MDHECLARTKMKIGLDQFIRKGLEIAALKSIKKYNYAKLKFAVLSAGSYAWQIHFNLDIKLGSV